MATALEMVLATSPGLHALEQLEVGTREVVETDIDAVFEVEAHVAGIGQVKFNRHDLAMALVNSTRCVAVLEGRSRGAEHHLHVQTFFPKLGSEQITRLLDAKTAPGGLRR